MAAFAAALFAFAPIAAVADGGVTSVRGSAVIPNGETVTYTFKPEGEAPHPAILFLQGYPCRTAAPDDPRNLSRNKLIASFVEAGYLVHIAEKPGLGGGASTKACKDLLYQEEVAAFQSVLDQLLQNAEVDADNLYIFGHSMGGQTAPLIARDRKVKGIITYGIHAKPWFEFMIDITRAQAERLGMDPVTANKETATVIPFLYDLMIEKKEWSYLKANHKAGLSVGVFRGEEGYLNGRYYTFWASLNDAAFIDAWADFDGKVLALYGEYDIASISAEGAQRIARTVNYHKPGHATAQIVPKTGHGFATLDASFEDYLSRRLTAEWAGEQEAALFNPAVPDRVIKWLESQ
ncbi:MAG: prolyl oligopeptidase family serine peptidase [Pseudomonadota bacterium]